MCCKIVVGTGFDISASELRFPTNTRRRFDIGRRDDMNWEHEQIKQLFEDHPSTMN